MTQSSPLFTSFTAGALALPNRLVMAPMTRSRANNEGNVPDEQTVKYYVQRATAGLIITEGAQISPQGVGYVYTPGIYSEQQVAGWKKVTDAVHAAGGLMVMQLWHVGAISHPFFHDGELPVAPSAVQPTDVQAFTGKGMEEIPIPRALTTSEVKAVINDFRKAAENARKAGFDGVEIHGANGYLVDQFIQDSTNQRTDEYGGSLENRARFALEAVQAAADVFGADRVGIRLSPTGAVGGINDSDRLGTFSYVTEQLNQFGLAYLHVIEALPGHRMAAAAGQEPVGPALRKIFTGPFILNGGYTKETAEAALANDEADLIAFGIPFIANPDLVARYEQGTALNTPDPTTFYGGDEKGYTDYPALGEPVPAQA